jgi:curli biogenesis system outer membrane secretion channel CsgG
MKPAEVNLSAVDKIAVLDFDYPRTERTNDLLGVLLLSLAGKKNELTNTPESRVADNFTRGLVEALNGTSYFQIIDTRGVMSSVAGSADVNPVVIGQKSGVQAIVVGEFTNMARSDKYVQREEEIKDPQTGVKRRVKVGYIDYTDTIALSYRVINTVDGSILATKTFQAKAEQEIKADGKAKPTDYEESMKNLSSQWFQAITRQLAPYTVTEYRTLVSDKAKDPNMKDADKFVKDKNYDAALAKYLEIWEKTGNPAAGTNAAIMYDVKGKLDYAVSFLKIVIQKTNDSAAVKELSRMQRAQEEARKLAEQAK